MQTDILHNKYFLHIQNLRISESFNPDHYLGPEYRWSYYTRSAVFPLLIGWGDIITEVLLYCLTITSAYHWLWQRADCADATWRSVVVVNVHQVIGRLVCGVGGERPSGNIVCWGEGVRGLWDRAVVCTVSHRTETCGISRYRHCIYIMIAIVHDLGGFHIAASTFLFSLVISKCDLELHSLYTQWKRRVCGGIRGWCEGQGGHLRRLF